MNVGSTFEPGTGDRENRESGANGRNIEDYVFNDPRSTGVERDWWDIQTSCTGGDMGSLSGGDLLSLEAPRLVSSKVCGLGVARSR